MSDKRPFIQIESVSKSFGNVRAVNNVTLDIGEGELFCLLGGSGCGKTTLLRMLGGFEQPSLGRILIGGEDVTNLDPTQRPVNMMFQNYALFPHMTVARNIEYGLIRGGIAASERQDRVQKMLKLVRLEELGARKPNQLSGGQKQRVALARALAKSPKVLLLDEPLAALDKKLRQETQYELINIQESLGTTFVLVTHDQEEAMTLATRIGVMNEGELIQVDEPKVLYEKPSNRFIADFLGMISFMEGKVSEVCADSTSIVVEVPGLDKGLCVDALVNATSIAVGENVTLAVRPERFELSQEPTGADNSIPASVEDMAFLGDRTDYRIRTKSGHLLKAVLSNHNRRSVSFTWNDDLWINFSSTDAIVLLS